MAEVPHLGQITVNAIVYQQRSDGQFDPKAVWHDSFSINTVEDTPEKAIEKIKQLIEVLKNGSSIENRPVPSA